MTTANLFRLENILNLLLVFVPVAFLVHWLEVGSVTVFFTSAVAIIPLAGLMGRATEALAAKLGEGIGGLLNATFGNAAELIIALMALRSGLHDVVKASITGSIIGNIFLVFGLSILVAGFKSGRLTFNRTAATMGATLLTLGGIGLIVPAVSIMWRLGRTRRMSWNSQMEGVQLLAVYIILAMAFFFLPA